MKSKKELDEEKDSVFDFMYVDFERIASFTSQFSDFGSLTEILHSRSASRKSSSDDTMRLKGDILVAKGEGEHSEGYGAEHGSESQKTYDGRWLAPLLFLEEAQSRGLLVDGLQAAVPGQLVLVKGQLKIRELSTLQRIWKLPTVQHFTKAGIEKEPSLNRQARRRENASKVKKKDEPPSEMDLFFDLIDVMPHKLQCLIGQDDVAWSILEDENLTGKSTDFVLKYGSNIPGEWALVGILDALPDHAPLADGIIETQDLNQVSDAISRIIEPITRQLVGRPEVTYGVTPILIFREVGNVP